MNFLNRFFGHSKKVKLEVEKPPQVETEQSKLAKWKNEHLSELVITTLCPEKMNWESDLAIVWFSYSDTYISYRAFQVDGQLCWYTQDKWGDDEKEYVYAPLRLIEQWYSAAWTRGNGFLWLADKDFFSSKDAIQSADTEQCRATAKRALHLINSSLEYIGCFGDDFPIWVMTHIGVKAILALARSRIPVEVEEVDAYKYAMASRFFHIPIRVHCLGDILNKRDECIVGYGRPFRSKEDWVSLGEEEKANWPNKDEVLAHIHVRANERAPELIKAWDAYFQE